MANNTQVRVFNSAGLHSASLVRTFNDSFDGLASRTKSFSAEGDFLTFMNNTNDDTQQITNANFLRDELAGDGVGLTPMEIETRNPAMRAAAKAASDAAGWFNKGTDPDPGFADAKDTYLQDIDGMIAQGETDMQNEALLAEQEGRPINNVLQMFPPVRAAEHVTLPNSIHPLNWNSKVRNANPNLAKMAQHKMDNVVSGMTKTLAEDKAVLTELLKTCG